MANIKITPDETQMRRYLERGLSQSEIVEAWEKDSGNRCSRGAIGMAIGRMGLKSAHHIERYDDLIPWSIRDEHKNHRDLTMLRTEARRRRNLPISDAKLKTLTNWRKALQESDAVVLYNPDTAEGFWWVHRKPEDEGRIIRLPE